MTPFKKARILVLLTFFLAWAGGLYSQDIAATEKMYVLKYSLDCPLHNYFYYDSLGRLMAVAHEEAGNRLPKQDFPDLYSLMANGTMNNHSFIIDSSHYDYNDKGEIVKEQIFELSRYKYYNEFDYNPNKTLKEKRVFVRDNKSERLYYKDTGDFRLVYINRYKYNDKNEVISVSYFGCRHDTISELRHESFFDYDKHNNMINRYDEYCSSLNKCNYFYCEKYNYEYDTMKNPYSMLSQAYFDDGVVNVHNVIYMDGINAAYNENFKYLYNKKGYPTQQDPTTDIIEKCTCKYASFGYEEITIKK